MLWDAGRPCWAGFLWQFDLSDPATDPSLEFAKGVACERGGVWRRVAAFTIDLAIATLLLQVLAFALYPATGGRVQFAGGFMLLYCDKLAALPEGFTVPTDFVPTTIADCRQGLFQLTSARVLNVMQVRQNGALTTTKQITFLRDVAGKPVAQPILGLLWLPLLFVLRLLFDRRNGTPGRRLLGVRLAEAATGRYPPAPPDVIKRYLLQALPLGPFVILPVLLNLLDVEINPFGTAWWIMMTVPAICAGVGLLIALHAVIYRREAFYDSRAGTGVVRVGERSMTGPSAQQVPPPPSLVAGEQAVADALGILPADLPASSSIVLPPPLPRRANYLVRHWRGELSLPVSYWVNGTVLGAGLGVVIGVLGHVLNERGSEYLVLWLVSVIAIWASIVLLRIWVTVGVWRAASHYQASGKSFWGGAAKVVTTLGVAYVAYSCLFVAAPQIAGVYEIVTGDTRVGPHQFRVLANGRGLEFSGGITFGVAHELETLLDAMSSVRTVQLNSIGGRMREAQKMADLIKARGLNTYVALSCLSACTVVFLGGKERVLLARSGKLGFHQTSFRGMTALDRQAAIETEIARLRGFGLSRAFAEHVTATPPSSMWYPDQNELLREKVATRLYVPAPSKPAGGSTPPATAAPEPSAAEGGATPAAAANPTTPSSTGADPATPGQPTQIQSGTYQTGRAFIPAELMKRLTAKPVAKATTTETPKN
ncbi:RDD family protein [Bradyrhizobium sp. Ce-3]|uniref:RDD family protein n=1 Tax=Bradyrhizobium sp. Ce-3 TaxID=2913970 RepID=UPI001FC7EE82|nr:RDD family protein [Bradyrhizobium sp. Ce-3]GKQ56086.1 hypothetical protein BRSPCE3_69410 [Bradyrhizobium sp. Ce-3]